LALRSPRSKRRSIQRAGLTIALVLVIIIITTPLTTAEATITTIMRSARDATLSGSAAHPVGSARPEALLKLLTFLSPAFPVGAFSYSHGLEQAIDSGAIRSAEALQAWLIDLLEIGGAWTDAVLFVESYRAAAIDDLTRLHTVAELAAALSPSRERHLEATAQGRAFLDAISASWPCASANALLGNGGATYSVAVAAIAADHRIALKSALPAYLNAFVANLISVGVRLIPIGQNAGLGVLSALHPLIGASALRAEKSTLDDLGSATILSDIASMRHEVQYSRVFRT
jgi:urease accessory protein